ncbi:MAG: phosphoribosyl-AMP cyclohydrolase [Oscillospiraceae bacterium]|nr:phosphoribosyl-AMP cyclohydrolase [Oscillospiraceae bacterium]
MNIANLFIKSDLIPVIVQDADTNQVLMLGFVNQLALEKTLETQKGHFWSRSRNKLWLKGETSGNFLHIVSIIADCDEDSLLYRVNPVGPTCHTGETSCFYKEIAL